MRVLFVCTAGLLRSPTAARMFATKTVETRARGCETNEAGRMLTPEDIEWATDIIAMEKRHTKILRERFGVSPPYLAIPDRFERDAPALVELLHERVPHALQYASLSKCMERALERSTKLVHKGFLSR
jgi:predicted protein tyrosine phosphatase